MTLTFALERSVGILPLIVSYEWTKIGWAEIGHRIVGGAAVLACAGIIAANAFGFGEAADGALPALGGFATEQLAFGTAASAILAALGDAAPAVAALCGKLALAK